MIYCTTEESYRKQKKYITKVLTIAIISTIILISIVIIILK